MAHANEDTLRSRAGKSGRPGNGLTPCGAALQFTIRKKSDVKFSSDFFLFTLHSTPMRVSFQMEKTVDKEEREKVRGTALNHRSAFLNIFHRKYYFTGARREREN